MKFQVLCQPPGVRVRALIHNAMGHHAAYVTAWQEAQGAFKINVSSGSRVQMQVC